MAFVEVASAARRAAAWKRGLFPFGLIRNNSSSSDTDKDLKTTSGGAGASSLSDLSASIQDATEHDDSLASRAKPFSALPLSESPRTAAQQSTSRSTQQATGIGMDYFLSTLKGNVVADDGIDSADSSLRTTPKQTSDMSRLLHDMLVSQEQLYHVHINASMNNTILSLTDEKGNVLCRSSGGTTGFKKSHRGGYEAAHQAAVALIAKAHEKGYKTQEIEIIFKGVGPGREAAYKAIAAPESKWQIRRLTDATPIPFNGCRPPKARRL